MMDSQPQNLEPIPTELLREKIRNYTQTHREKLRADNSDALRFGLGEIKTKIEKLQNLSEKDVSGLASRIKRRKHATVEDMYRLSHAFLQSIENIRAFAKITGAIQVLIKELTGNAAEREVSAAECLCNLSLGEGPVCEKIASLAGSYLVTYLDSNEERLKRTSLWTLANLLATQSKAAHVLMQMELLPKLWQLYIAPNSTNTIDAFDDYREDAGICIQLISLKASKLLSSKDFELLFDNMLAKDPNSIAGEYHLQIIHNCDLIKPTVILNEQQLIYLINYALVNLCGCNDFNSSANRLRISYAIRIMANLLASQQQTYQILLQQVSLVWHTNFVDILNKIFGYLNEDLTLQAMWLLNNLLKQQKEENQINTINSDFLAKLNIYYKLSIKSNVKTDNDNELNQMRT